VHPSAGLTIAKSKRLWFATRLLRIRSDSMAIAHHTPAYADETSLSKQTNDKIDMNALPIHITPHGIELSFALRKFIEKKVSRVSRFASDILSAEVVLREKSGGNGVFSVSARLALPGRDVHANAVHVNFYAAINQLVARLARLSRKRKTRFEKRKRRAGRFEFGVAASRPALKKRHREKRSENLLRRSIISLSPQTVQI
jgi:ribosomal subunit interface protein